jgi:hypothetical protein
MVVFLNFEVRYFTCIMLTAKICPHLANQPQLETLQVLDSHLHMTDGFVRCTVCGATYLLEAVDMTSTACLFRVSAVDDKAADRTLQSLRKGSCDINRARDEVFNLSNDATELKDLLLMRNGIFACLVTPPASATIARTSWRQLPCDGSLIRLCTDRHPC